MTKEDFRRWLVALDLPSCAAAKVIGCSKNTVTAYENGRSKIPRYIALACAAIAHDLGPWK